MKQTLLFLGFFLSTLGAYSQCFSNISSGDYFNLGLKPNGTIWGWGSSVFGQMGNGSEADLYVPTQISNATDWQTIVSGPYNTFAIKTNGTMWASGDNLYGQLGIGSTVSYTTTFTQVGTETNWTKVSGSRGFTIALKTNGTLWAWGQNDTYQMGNGTCCSNRLSPEQIGTDSDWILIDAALTRTAIAIKSNGTLWGWGLNSTGLIGPSNVGSRQYPTQLRADTDWATISVGNGHALALKSNGTLWGWGSGFDGQAGDTFPEIYFRDTPVQIGTDTNWIYIGTGYNTSYAIKSDGSLWGWGRNDTGQVGDGTTTNRRQPVQVGTDTDWVRATGGFAHGIAQKANGAIYTWGSNDFGQLGNGTMDAVSLPTGISVPGCTLDTDEFSTIKMVIAPNPVQEVLHFSYRGNTVVNGLKVYDMLGRVVYGSSPVATNQLQVSLPLVLPKGIYLLMLESNGSVVVSERFVKE
jgi:alpha-tubulin suppressor-like RCC1 family protein